MKRLLSLILIVTLVMSLCCFGTAYAEETKPSAAAEETEEKEAPEEIDGGVLDAEDAAEEADESADEKTEPADDTEEAAEPADETDEFAEEAEEDEEDEEEPAAEDAFADWNPDAPALHTLIDYVEAVTDEASPDYIPTEDRIAVFDMDGTLYGELFPTYLEYYMLAWRILKDESITPDAEMLALGRELRESVITHQFASDMPMRHAIQAARAYAGMTQRDFADFVNSILIRDVDGFEGMTYATAFYQPMLEVIDYLQDNDFRVYVCSGSDRAICRALLEGMIDIPYANIIGMDVGYEATGQGDTDGLDYVFKAGDDVVRTDRLIIKNLKMNKVLQIVQDIGQKPVLSFGNSSGDVSMHMYTINNNPYRSAAFMLVADDDVRDYGNPEKTAPLKEKWAENGFHVISMRDDFRTIYGDNVIKTGVFHWAEDLAENREAAPAPAPAESAAEPETSEGVQYVLYLGTNDKDTNRPVFTQAEAQEKLKDILIRHFGGYTIQDALGGWVGDDKLYQEYTLVIYLSDTTEEAVHAAADEMLETFQHALRQHRIIRLRHLSEKLRSDFVTFS